MTEHAEINLGGTASGDQELRSDRMRLFVLLLFGAMVVVLSIEQIADDDIFWHLATGRWIVQHGAVPGQDVFGFITEGQPWIPFEWGWDVLTYGLYVAGGGYTLLQILPAVIWLVIVWLQIGAMRKLRIITPVMLLTLSTSMAASLFSIAARPHIITLLGLTIVGYIIFTYKYDPNTTPRRLYVLPPMFLIWANMHPGVLAGLLLLFIILLSEVILHYLVKSRPADPPAPQIVRGMDAESILKLEIIFSLCVVAAMINPHGLSTFEYVYEHTRLRVLTTIKEWLPPFGGTLDNPLTIFYIICIVLGFSGVIYGIRRRYPLTALLYIGYGLQSLRAVRFVADFTLVSSYGTAIGLNDLIVAGRDRLRRLLDGRMMMALLSVLILTGIVAITDGTLYTALRYHRHFGFGLDRHFFSEELMQFMRDNRISGRPFNQFEIGGQLIWELPGQQNFIDSRNLNDEIAAAYYSISDMSPGFEQKLAMYDIDMVIIVLPELPHSPGCMERTLARYCSSRPESWKLVYWDDHSLLYLRNIPRFADVIGRYEYRTLDPYRFAFHHRELDSLMLRDRTRFEGELNRKFREEPDGRILKALYQYDRIKHGGR